MMASITIKHFDTLDFVDKSKELGVDEKVAKYQARQIEQAIDIAVNTMKSDIENKELATKTDIKELELKIEQVRSEIQQVRGEIQKSKNDLTLWITGIMITLLVASGVIQHFFK